MLDQNKTYLFRQLAQHLRGDLYDNAFDRGRYATDASIYQMFPQAVVVPKDLNDVETTMEFVAKHNMMLLPRGGGTSQCGQTVNHAVVLDFTKHLNRILELDVAQQRCLVEPGITLDELNRQLKPYGLWYPVDVSTSSRATIGGMAGNNSCGGRSIRYGMMRDNVLGMHTILADGTKGYFGQLEQTYEGASSNLKNLIGNLLDIGERYQNDILAGFPDVMRRVGGYNIDALIPNGMHLRPGQHKGEGINLSHLLVGSEGTLACTTAVELKLSPIPAHSVMGVCHFPSFFQAMDAAKHIVKLDPVAVELIDDTMIELARSIDIFVPTVKEFVRGEPAALLVVEFAENDADENLHRLSQLHDLMAELGLEFSGQGEKCGGVVDAKTKEQQARVSDMRKSGLNIMMSMKSDAKPVSFVEDCAVSLEDLPYYTDKLRKIFDKHGVAGTWYAHASVGCLHVRPVLDMRKTKDVKIMRAIAEEAFELVRGYKGSHSGEHGDGIVRSEFNDVMFGPVLPKLFRQVKNLFDPNNMMNPGKIVDAPRMDEQSLFRFAPGYQVEDRSTSLDWRAWPGSAGGFQGAVEMCNNNGACRKLQGGVMCPSFRATRNERDSTRGRANSLRLALSGQLGKSALTSPEMADTMKLCVSCKACKRECPTGVDMARMKTEITAMMKKEHGYRLHDYLVGYLPAYAGWVRKVPTLVNALQSMARIPGINKIFSRMTGFTHERPLPNWSSRPFDDRELPTSPTGNGDPVIVFVDSFNRNFEPDVIRAGIAVLRHAGYDPFLPPSQNGQPICCGKTFLASGFVDKAKSYAQNLVDSFSIGDETIPIIGFEPSCTLAIKDDVIALLANEKSSKLAQQVMLFEEFLARAPERLQLQGTGEKVLLHGHCHQKAFDAVSPIQQILSGPAQYDVELIQSSCCGMAGSFGYADETYDISMKMASADLLPTINKANEDVLVAADGTSCRQQIAHGSKHQAQHVAQLLARLIT
ncbi:MAG: FAD-binding and (Fe-S)-binding domain-containing protein [Alphaproteobacteria bacterium]